MFSASPVLTLFSTAEYPQIRHSHESATGSVMYFLTVPPIFKYPMIMVT